MNTGVICNPNRPLWNLPNGRNAEPVVPITETSVFMSCGVIEVMVSAQFLDQCIDQPGVLWIGLRQRIEFVFELFEIDR